jgi:hypothetical protein
MSSPTFIVNYPKGFLDKANTASSGVRIRNYTNKDLELYGSNPVIPSLVLETSIALSLETLTTTFNTIINTFKLNPDKYLALHKISDILTNEESVVKYALVKLNGTQGRCFTIKNTDTASSLSFPFVTYNPNLKEIKKHLLMLFNKFLNCKDKNKEDIIMYEGQPLFIHLFAIIIDSFHFPNPEVLIKKDCTDTFAMITLLELLLKKKYKHLLDFHINKIPLPKIEVKENLNDDDSEDDDWDREDFEPCKQLHNSTFLPLIPSLISSTTIIDPISEDYNYTKNDEVSDALSNKITDELTDEIPDDWDSL